MKYLDTKKGSLEEAVQQSMSGVVAKDLLEAGGKYLKYSDLLLQKGRLMQQGKSTAMIDREISKEMKKLGIKESKDEYEKFFNSALKKFKIDSPADLKTDAKKKEFFNYVDKNYKAKEESNLQEKERTYTVVHIKKGKEIIKTSKGTYDAAKKYAKMKGLRSTAGVDVHLMEELDKEDTPTVKKVVKMLKKASKAHADQAKTLSKDLQDEVLHETEIEFDPTDFKQNKGPISNKDVADTVKRLQKEFPGIKGKKTGKHTIKFDHTGTGSMTKAGGFSVNKLALALDGMGFSLSDKERSTKLRGIRGEYEPDNVDETLDKIREANVAKQKSMREILADIWNMNEGKNPFDLEEQKIKIMFDMIPDKDFDNFAKKNKLKTKVIKPGRNTDEVEVTGDKRAIEKLLKLKGETLSDYKMDSRTKRYMYDEGFASDAQRRAAFASGYKEKGKKKKEEVEKDGKTATGQKPTKVEIEPEVK